MKHFAHQEFCYYCLHCKIHVAFNFIVHWKLKRKMSSLKYILWLFVNFSACNLDTKVFLGNNSLYADLANTIKVITYYRWSNWLSYRYIWWKPFGRIIFYWNTNLEQDKTYNRSQTFTGTCVCISGLCAMEINAITIIHHFSNFASA